MYSAGAKFGGFGSFLPAYERFPPRGQNSYHDNDHGFDDGIDPDVSLYIVRSFYLYLYLFLSYTLN